MRAMGKPQARTRNAHMHGRLDMHGVPLVAETTQGRTSFPSDADTRVWPKLLHVGRMNLEQHHD